MSGKHGQAFHDLRIYQRYEVLSDLLWDAVESWQPRYQSILGDQMLRAVDSIGANIAESVGRGHLKESQHHLYYSRGSLTETQHWIRKAVRRSLLTGDVILALREQSTILHKQLNAFIRAQKRQDNIPTKGRQYPERVQDRRMKYGKRRRLIQESKGQKLKPKSQEPRAKSQEPGAKSLRAGGAR